MLNADPDLLKQLFTKSFMKFHDRPDLQMRLAEGEEITSEGMLAAKCAHLPFVVGACHAFVKHLTKVLSFKASQHQCHMHHTKILHLYETAL